jgi:hypothetical protein
MKVKALGTFCGSQWETDPQKVAPAKLVAVLSFVLSKESQRAQKPY